MKILILFLLFTTSIFAQSVEVIVNPKNPVMGESFNVIFKVSTKDGTDPLISFDPRGIEVLGRENSGISTRTTYINGKLTVERSISTTYEMMSPKAGTKFLTNIQVEINGKKVSHKNVNIRVLRVPVRAKNIMAIAVVDKTEAFVGEAILVRYYLYYKTNVSSTDVKKFPKLNKFLKRFHQERLRPERVQVGNDIYTRSVIYTAQLFGEKPGLYKVDPISLSVNYSQSRGGAFGGFGFGRQMKKTVSSKPIEIQIKQLPLDGIPKDFTGLVGKHEFELTLNKNKFLVNEPIEMKLRVKGEGALELFDTPKILTSDKLEEFESSNDFQVSPDFTAQKEFNITYLGREAYVSEAKTIGFSYFNPETLKYERATIDLGKVEVAGTGQISKSSSKAESPVDGAERVVAKPITQPKKFDLTPVYALKNNYIVHRKFLIALIIIIILFIIGFRLRDRYIEFSQRDLTLIQEIRKNGLTYGRLHELLFELSNKTSMKENIEASGLSQKSKKYLLELEGEAQKLYAKGTSFKKIKMKTGVLNEIAKQIKKKDTLDEA